MTTSRTGAAGFAAICATAFAVGLALTTTAPAQNAIVVPEQTETFELSPADEVIVRRTIIEERIRPSDETGSITMIRPQVRVGSVVPIDVDLYAFSGDVIAATPAMGSYRYFLSPDQKIVVVEPETRRVVRVLEQR